MLTGVLSSMNWALNYTSRDVMSVIEGGEKKKEKDNSEYSGNMHNIRSKLSSSLFSVKTAIKQLYYISTTL